MFLLIAATPRIFSRKSHGNTVFGNGDIDTSSELTAATNLRRPARRQAGGSKLTVRLNIEFDGVEITGCDGLTRDADCRAGRIEGLSRK